MAGEGVKPIVCLSKGGNDIVSAESLVQGQDSFGLWDSATVTGWSHVAVQGYCFKLQFGRLLQNQWMDICRQLGPFLLQGPPVPEGRGSPFTGGDSDFV